MPPAVGNETSDAPSSTICPSAPVVVGVVDIVNAAINNSINTHAINNSIDTHASTSAPAAITTTTAEPTAGSFIQTANELSRESDGTAAEDAQQAEFVVDKRAELERKRKQKQQEKQELQQRQLEEMKNAPLEAIQLTADSDDVRKIGSVVWETPTTALTILTSQTSISIVSRAILSWMSLILIPWLQVTMMAH
jgi:hypothetical protein